MTNFADQIVNEFIRLAIDTDCDPCSGLMADEVNLITEVPTVKIYDDYASGIYDAQKTLEYLKGLKPREVSLASESTENIWQHIGEFEL